MTQQAFDISKAPPRPDTLRAEPRLAAARAAAPAAGPAALASFAGLEADGRGLIRSTLKAGAAALGTLVVFVLPAEYGADPTGVGGLLGLTPMGEIKQQLYAEAAAEDAALAVAAEGAVPVAAPDLGPRLDRIEAQLAALVTAMEAAPEPASGLSPEEALAALNPSSPEATPPIAAAPAAPSVAAEPAPAAESPAWRDEFTATLAPGEGIEVKLAMQEGETATFVWSANGGVLNHATHGDGGGQEVSYEDGRAVPGQEGTLTAAFAGNHGWFWRNRSDATVTLTLRTGGEYERMVRP